MSGLYDIDQDISLRRRLVNGEMLGNILVVLEFDVDWA
jgi:hypothetical protein